MFKYVNLNNAENRKCAIKYVQEIELYWEYTKEPICITNERADFFIKQANWYLQELERLLEQEKKSDKVPFYDWLNENR